MTNPNKRFYTVAEAAAELRVDKATLYRAIRDDAFPAIKLRARYVIPAKALEQLIDQAAATGQVIDVAKMAAERRMEREVARLRPEWAEAPMPERDGSVPASKRPSGDGA